MTESDGTMNLPRACWWPGILLIARMPDCTGQESYR